MQNLMGFVYGAAFGVALVVPGLSGGTFLVILGCYDLVCEALALNFKTIKKHFVFFILFAAGAVGGLVGFVHVVTFLIEHFRIQTYLFFTGLILGGIPLIKNIATKDEKIKLSCLPAFLTGLALVVCLFLFERYGVFGDSASGVTNVVFYLRVTFSAIIAAIAMIIPGISGTFVLIAFGVYDMFIQAVRLMDMTVLLPAAAGILLGIVAGARLMLYILKKSQLIIYSAILGMVVGSIAPLFPGGLGLNITTLAGFVCLALGFFVAVNMGKKVSDA